MDGAKELLTDIDCVPIFSTIPTINKRNWNTIRYQQGKTGYLKHESEYPRCNRLVIEVEVRGKWKQWDNHDIMHKTLLGDWSQTVVFTSSDKYNWKAVWQIIWLSPLWLTNGKDEKKIPEINCWHLRLAIPRQRKRKFWKIARKRSS